MGWDNVIAEIRGSADLSRATELIADSLATKGDFEAVGVFLLDGPGRNLVLYASWSSQFGSRNHQNFKVPLDKLHWLDPLCYAIREGRIFLSSMLPVLPAPLRLFYQLHGQGRPTGVCPLFGGGNRCIGGIICVSSQPIDTFSEAFIAQCNFSGIFLDSLVRQQGHQNRSHEAGHKRSTERLADGLEDLAVLQGKSLAAIRLKKQLKSMAGVDLPVLITGPGGAGKKEYAAALHLTSQRRESPFVLLQCGLLTPLELESELFGHVRGAFPGADSDYTGRFRGAGGGTVVSMRSAK